VSQYGHYFCCLTDHTPALSSKHEDVKRRANAHTALPKGWRVSPIVGHDNHRTPTRATLATGSTRSQWRGPVRPCGAGTAPGPRRSPDPQATV